MNALLTNWIATKLSPFCLGGSDGLTLCICKGKGEKGEKKEKKENRPIEKNESKDKQFTDSLTFSLLELSQDELREVLSFYFLFLFSSRCFQKGFLIDWDLSLSIARIESWPKAWFSLISQNFVYFWVILLFWNFFFQFWKVIETTPQFDWIDLSHRIGETKLRNTKKVQNVLQRHEDSIVSQSVSINKYQEERDTRRGEPKDGEEDKGMDEFEYYDSSEEDEMIVDKSGPVIMPTRITHDPFDLEIDPPKEKEKEKEEEKSLTSPNIRGGRKRTGSIKSEFTSPFKPLPEQVIRFKYKVQVIEKKIIWTDISLFSALSWEDFHAWRERGDGKIKKTKYLLISS